MEKDNVLELKKKEFVKDPLTEMFRHGARKLLAEALDAEINSFMAGFAHLKDEEGKSRLARNGYHPERTIQTGIGDVPVKAPRIRDRAPDKERIIFTSSLLPPYLRRTKSIEELIPWLYLKGISTGDFSEALAALLGEGAAGLSSATICRLKSVWQEEYEEWRKRDLSGKKYVYLWADGVYSNVRMDDKQCLLVIIGLLDDGSKELLAIEDGYRESEQSWHTVLLDLKARGLVEDPALAIGDGSLGFWKALSKIYGKTRWQRCWVHKTANILNKLPKGVQKQAKQKIHDIWMAPDKEGAEKNFNLFIESYEAKYPKAAECLAKDRDVLLTFYDFPAEHWKHIRTTNPIESTFATVKLRTAKARGCFSRETVLTMAYRLILSAQKKWQRIAGFKKLAKVIEGVKFINGVEEERNAA